MGKDSIYIYTGNRIRPPNAGYLEPHWCHLVLLLPCFPFGFLLEACQIGELHWYHLVLLPFAGQIGEPHWCHLVLLLSWPAYQDLGTRILVPRFWYQDLGTKILVRRSWYQDLGTIFREKVKPITTPPDKVFKRPG